MGVVYNLWFWLTPIVYPVSILPDGLQVIVGYNPMTPVVGFYQEAILYGRWPSLANLIYPATVSFLLVLLSVFVFRRASPELVDVL
jgi:lipopolysaccharide transport system permease protein